jgi:hypothetical protein
LITFARLFNLPSTLEAVGAANVLNWKPEKVRAKLHELRKHGPIFNGAYIVSTNGKSMGKVDYLIQYVLGPLWAARKALRPATEDTLASYHAKLMKFDGLGSFMAAQVIGDIKHVKPLKDAADWWTWAASGPGSRRGLNRVFMYETNAPWREDSWLQHLTLLRVALLPLLGGMELHAQDVQNIGCCEFDKMERARLGEGRPKQLYKERVS